jgi:hypothetical protein
VQKRRQAMLLLKMATMNRIEPIEASVPEFLNLKEGECSWWW